MSQSFIMKRKWGVKKHKTQKNESESDLLLANIQSVIIDFSITEIRSAPT